MTPIFTEIALEDIGEHMKAYAEENGCMSHHRRALIGSYWAKMLLLATPLLKFYLEKGLMVTEVYEAVQWNPSPAFAEFAKFMTTKRREGDSGGSTVNAETAKTVGNAGHGRFLMDVTRHRKIIYTEDDKKIRKEMDSVYFEDIEQITDSVFELKMEKKKHIKKLPIQIGFFVYQYAKLKMLQFYYEFLDHFLDSTYLALAAEKLESLVKPELRSKFDAEKSNWLPCTDTPEHRAYDKRTPGLFKVEWQGDGFVGLNSNTYYCWGQDKDKSSCKGISKKNNEISKDVYLEVLKTRQTKGGTNRGFRVVNNKILTYSQFRDGFTYLYPKRKVLEDGVTTVPLDL